MKFNLDDLNPGAFFPFEDNEESDDKGGVTVRLANGKIIANIDKKCTKKSVKYHRNQRHEVIEEDDELRSQMLWDYVITDWVGLEDNEGQEIPCTKENKIKLMQGSVKFSGFVGNCVEQLTADSDMYDEKLEKN